MERNRQMLEALWDAVVEYDRWIQLGHRRQCSMYRIEEAEIVEALLNGTPLTAEQQRVRNYLRRCPICRKVMGEMIEMFKGSG